MVTSVTPLVSVIIPTRNRPQWLPQAVDSVLAQTYSQLEIIIVDDASIPPVNIDHQDPRIHLVRQAQSQGVAAARNAGLNAASGDFLCFLDDDDVYYPHKIATQLAFLQAHPDIDMVFSRVKVVNAQGESHYYLHAKYVHNTLNNFAYFNVIHTNATLFRRRVLEKARFDPRLRKYDDTQFHLQMSLHYKLYYLHDTVAVWHQHGQPDQLTARNYRRSLANFRLICAIFDNYIQHHRWLKKRYYTRLGALAVLNVHIPLALWSLWQWLKPSQN